MIVVRDVFQLQFGKAKEATSLLKQGQQALKGTGYPVERILADVTGECDGEPRGEPERF